MRLEQATKEKIVFDFKINTTFITIFSFQWLRHTNYLKLIYNNRFNKTALNQHKNVAKETSPTRHGKKGLSFYGR